MNASWVDHFLCLDLRVLKKQPDFFRLKKICDMFFHSIPVTSVGKVDG
jgi:hypothetical protein